MSADRTGGPAFPHQSSDGLTMRDYFAAKAMQGELASQRDNVEWTAGDQPALADWAYAVADAMLKARLE